MNVPVPYHSKLRRSFKNFFDKILRFFSPKASTEAIDKEQIKKIFIVRINYRIGNMLFVTPLVEQLQKECPNATIDILLGAPFTKPLFSGFKNVENVFDFPRTLLRHPMEAWRYIVKLRKTRYDVVFNLNGGSASDRIATLLARAKYKVAFCNDGGFTPANRCVRRRDTYIVHEALKPLELMKIFEVAPDYSLKLSIAFGKEEKKEGERELYSLIGRHDDAKVVGIFRNARYEKKLSDDFWSDLIDALKRKNKKIIFIDILSPDIPEKLREDMFEYSQKDLRKLAAFMANLDAFICGDTGPMHLASASGVPTIALFKTTAPDLYGTLKERDLSIVLKDLCVDEVAEKIISGMKRVK